MLDRIESLEREFGDVEARLADPDVFADQARYRELARRHKELDAIVTVGRELRQRTDDAATAREQCAQQYDLYQVDGHWHSYNATRPDAE